MKQLASPYRISREKLDTIGFDRLPWSSGEPPHHNLAKLFPGVCSRGNQGCNPCCLGLQNGNNVEHSPQQGSTTWRDSPADVSTSLNVKLRAFQPREILRVWGVNPGFLGGMIGMEPIRFFTRQFPGIAARAEARHAYRGGGGNDMLRPLMAQRMVTTASIMMMIIDDY